MRRFFPVLAAFILIANSGIASPQEKIWQPEDLKAYIALSNRGDAQSYLVEGHIVIIGDSSLTISRENKEIPREEYLEVFFPEEIIMPPYNARHAITLKSKNGNVELVEGVKYLLRVKVPAKVNNPVELQEILE